MESKKEKSKRYYDYLSGKRDQFVHSLTRVGVKLVSLNDGDFDLEYFVNNFLPPKDFLKNKIIAEVKESQTALVLESSLKENSGCIDSLLIDALKDEFTKFEKDFQELLTVADPDDGTSSGNSVTRTKKLRQQKQQAKCVDKKQQQNDESYCISQVLNPGEMSKIFVKKAGANVVRSKTDKPNFDDENLETIYIYRSKNC